MVYKDLNRTTLNRGGAWQAYREKLWSNIPQQAMGRVLLIGPGNLNDIDMNHLASHSHEVIALDVDRETVKEQDKLGVFHEIRSFDVTGIDLEESLRGFAKALSKGKGLSYIEEIKPDPLPVMDPFDTVMVSALYSQLFLTPMLMILSERDVRDKELIIDKLLGKGKDLIDFFNNWLLKQVKKGGQVILWTDLLELGEEIGAVQETLEDYVEAYHQRYGMSLPYYGHLSVREHLVKPRDHFLVWPLASKRNMIVQLTLGEKKDV